MNMQLLYDVHVYVCVYVCECVKNLLLLYDVYNEYAAPS